MFLILFINALMGATFSIVKIILDNYTDPFFLVGYRMTLAGVFLLSYQYLFNKKDFKITTKNDWFLFVQVAIFHVYICYICEFWSQKYLSPAKVALLFNLTPFATAFFSYIMYRQKQSFKKMAGLVIGFVGFLPILLSHESGELGLSNWLVVSWPEIAMLIAVMSAAYAWLIISNLVISRNYSIILINGFGMFFGGILALITSWVIGNYAQIFGLDNLANSWTPWPFSHFGILTIWVLILIIFSNLIYYNVYGWLLKYYSPTFLAFSGLTIPLFAAIWERLLLGTIITCTFWISLAIISLGLGIYYREELIKGK